MKWALFACALACTNSNANAATNTAIVWIVTANAAERSCRLESTQLGKKVSYYYDLSAPLGTLKIQSSDWNFTDGGAYRFRVVRTFSNGQSTTQSVLFGLAYGEDYIRTDEPSLQLLSYASLADQKINPEKIILDFDGADDIIVDVSTLVGVFPEYINCLVKVKGQSPEAIKTLEDAIFGPVQKIGNLNQEPHQNNQEYFGTPEQAINRRSNTVEPEDHWEPEN